ncbi:MAG: hypothetical protein E7Z87_03075 [Cyanobacteria bacterium SIG26]|nr:hypothetical protein [Cyanobacteria bacterium SIG26]
MKNLAIIIALLLIQTTIVANANTTTNNSAEPVIIRQTSEQPTEVKQTPSKNDYSDDYLLKYNIDDLEAAPWLHGGKRVY